MGDPAGIGPEIVVRTVGAALAAGHAPVLFGNRQTYRDAARICGLSLELEPFLAADTGTDSARPADAGWGSCTEWAGREQVASLRAALASAERGAIDAVVVGVVGDETEVLKAQCGLPDVRTVTRLDSLLRATVVGHVPFAGIAARVSGEGIVAALDRLSGLCAEFGIEAPRIGVAALNPHAGDRGTLGHEEADFIAPTLESYRTRTGAKVRGPIPADILMPLARRGEFDALVYLYHDQGNIAMKAVGFGREVVFYPAVPWATATVAHGTAYDIAGRGLADPQNFFEAVLQAADLAQRRMQAAARHRGATGG
jgi:4-hydroxythreonine-4-phosphate dehydrogenase